jgi:hypothetical protein
VRRADRSASFAVLYSTLRYSVMADGALAGAAARTHARRLLNFYESQPAPASARNAIASSAAEASVGARAA